MVVTEKQVPDVEQLRRAVEQAMAQRHRPVAAAPAAPDLLGQLEQLGKLRDAGVLTSEESEAKKSELLRPL